MLIASRNIISNHIRVRLFWKVAVYYGACFALLIGVGVTQPQLIKYLPFGGLYALQNEIPFANDVDLIPRLLATHGPLSLFDDAMNLISALAGALIVMVPVRWIYMAEGLKKSWSREVATSLLLLPLVVTTIVTIVKYSLPLAFALTGIFAGVRYRTTLKSQSDAFFTFACIAVGLSAGTRTIGIALVLAAFFSITILVATPTLDDEQTET